MVVESIAKETGKEISKEMVRENLKKMNALDRPLNAKEVNASASKELTKQNTGLDKPLNAKEGVKQNRDVENVQKVERMTQIPIEFKCPEGVDRKEFNRQLKGQERGLNSQTVLENMKNRNAFEQRKLETGNGRDLESGKKAQEIARQKAFQSRIESNQKKGMSYPEARKEAQTWISRQAALHNPDQIAGGDPAKVSRMGDAGVNASIGAQWKTRVPELKRAVDEYAKNKSTQELANTKMNVKLTVAP